MTAKQIGEYFYTLFENNLTAFVGQFDKTPSAVEKCDPINGKDIEINSSIQYESKKYTIAGIASRAFYLCQIKSVKLPSTLTFIDTSAFDLTNMEEFVELPKSLEYVGEWAFSVAAFEKVHIPDNLKEIGNGGFGCNKNLKNITISENNTFFKLDKQGILYDSSFTTIIQAPATLTEIIIPETVKIIQSAAFSYTKITELTIPRSVKTIYKQFVDCCYNLNKIVILGNVKFEEERIGSDQNHTINSVFYQGISPVNYHIFDPWNAVSITVCKGYKGGNKFAEHYAEINNHCQAYPYITMNEDQYNLNILVCAAIILYSK